MLPICRLKCNLHLTEFPKVQPKVRTSSLFIINNYVLICVISFLSIIITWNLSGFTVIWFFLNQSVIISVSLCKILIDSDTFSEKADNVLFSAKLCTHTINMKNNKSFIDKLKQKRTQYRSQRDTRNYIFKLTVSIINSNTLLTIWKVR